MGGIEKMERAPIFIMIWGMATVTWLSIVS
jgi:hypothetical protein